MIFATHQKPSIENCWFLLFFSSLLAIENIKNHFIFYFWTFLFGQNFGNNKKADFTTLVGMPKLTGLVSRRTCHPLNLRFPFWFRWKNVIWQFQARCTYNFRYFMIFTNLTSKQLMAWQEKTSEDVIKYHC
jgi:hypothetical protein